MAIIDKIGKYQYNCLFKKLSVKYIGILVISTAMAIIAAVAMYFSFGRLNAVKNAARRAPPVPTSPAKNPEIPPPRMLLVVVGLNCRVSLKNEIIEYKARNIPRMARSISWGRYFARNAPRIVNKILGNPNFKMRLFSMPYLKKAILPKLPNK